MNWRNVLERAGWTALQSALGSLTAVQIVDAIFGLGSSGEQGLMVAISTGIATALSFLKTLAQERLDHLNNQEL